MTWTRPRSRRWRCRAVRAPRVCRRCLRSSKPAWSTWKWRPGSACSRRHAPRAGCSSACAPRWIARRARPKCVRGWRRAAAGACAWRPPRPKPSFAPRSENGRGCFARRASSLSASMPDLQDQLAISALMQIWALARDTGDWDKLRATAHPGAAMTTTWFDGTFDAFVASCEASFGKGSRSQHFLGGTIAEIKGDRAIAQTRMSINVRSRLDGVEVDAVCVGRFFDRVEMREGAWRIAKRSVIYEKDRIDPVDPGARISLDPALLGRFPEGYRHLAYLQTKNGAHVNPNLPTARGEALEKLVAEAKAWLAAQ